MAAVPLVLAGQAVNLVGEGIGKVVDTAADVAALLPGMKQLKTATKIHRYDI